MISLFDDQEQFVADLRQSMRQHRAIMGYAPTGFGKTVVTSFIADTASKKGSQVIFAVHRQELIAQTAETFRKFGIKFGYIAAGFPYDPNVLVHIASIDTLKNRLHIVKTPKLFIIDEAHLAMAQGWKRCADHFKERGAIVLGNSGSPKRLDGKSLRDIFDTLVMGPSVRELMDAGRLSDYRYFAPNVPDMAGVKKSMGDYAKKELNDKMDKPKLTGDVVLHYKKLALNTRAVAFCVSVAHSQHIAEAFNASGVPAAHIDGTTPKGERKRIINDFADGRIKVLCNVELVTTGFDLSAQVGRDVPIETCILIRPTQSLALYLQMVGRALRAKPYPAIIIDHAGNSHRHGFPDDDREWSLEGETKGKGGGGSSVQPPYTCPDCFGQLKRPLPPVCHCGAFIRAEAREIETDDGELVEMSAADKAAVRAQLKKEEREAKTLSELVALAQRRGYKNPMYWAQKRFGSSKWRQEIAG